MKVCHPTLAPGAPQAGAAAASIANVSAAAAVEGAARAIDWDKEVLLPEDAGPLADRTDLRIQTVVPLFVAHEPNQVFVSLGKRLMVYSPGMGDLDNWRVCLRAYRKEQTQPIYVINLQDCKGETPLQAVCESVQNNRDDAQDISTIPEALEAACRFGLDHRYLVFNHKKKETFSTLFVLINVTDLWNPGDRKLLIPTYPLGTVTRLLRQGRAHLDEGGKLKNMDLKERFNCFIERHWDPVEKEVDGVVHMRIAHDPVGSDYGPFLPLLLERKEEALIDFLGCGIDHNKTKSARR